MTLLVSLSTSLMLDTSVVSQGCSVSCALLNHAPGGPPSEWRRDYKGLMSIGEELSIGERGFDLKDAA